MREVVRQFRAKLEQPRAHVQLLALSVRPHATPCSTLHSHALSAPLQALDACFKGCGRSFHEMMATKDVLDAVVRCVVSETLEYEPEVRNRAKRLVQSWAHATRLLPFQEALTELAVEGVDGAGAGVGGAGGARDPRVHGLDSDMKAQVAASTGAWRGARGGAASGAAAAEYDEDAEREELLRPRARAAQPRGTASAPASPADQRGAARGISRGRELPDVSSPPLSPPQRGVQVDGSVSPPHIGLGLVRSSSGVQRLHSSPTSPPETLSPSGRPAAAAPAPAPAVALPFHSAFHSADPEEAALLQEMLASNLKDEAEALYEAGHLEAAEKVFAQALIYAPLERALFCGRSQCAAARGAHAAALEDATSVVNLSPQWHVGHALRGAALAALGDRDAAMGAYDTAARLAQAGLEDASMEDAREYRQLMDSLRTDLR